MYNPYDLIKIRINNHELYGRPVAFDSEPADSHTLLNKEGDIIRPTRITSVCPDCGQGLELEIRVENPPFSMSYECHLCKSKDTNKSFINRPKVELSEYKADPLLQPNIITPLSERITGFVEDTKEPQESPQEDPQVDDISEDTSNVKKKAKKPKRKPRKATPKKTSIKQEDFIETKKGDKQLDKAEGMTEEVDLDDTDMIETE